MASVSITTTAQTVFVEDPDGWERAFKTWTGTLGTHLARKAVELEGIAKAEAPRPGGFVRNRSRRNYATGRLASAIYTLYEHSARGHELESKLYANVPHGKYVHGGTRPHMIYPDTAPALAFFWPRTGGLVNLLKVYHPGTAGNEFLTRAVNRVW